MSAATEQPPTASPARSPGLVLLVVSAAAVQQALEKVYPAPALVRELAAR